MDRRRTPANARVALESATSAPANLPRVAGVPARIAAPVADLLAAPEGSRDRQLLFGDTVTLIEARNGFSFVQAQKDGYVGYLPDTALAAPQEATHWVSSPATHLYAKPDFKSADRLSLSFGSRVQITSQRGRFCETPDGFIPAQHVTPLGEHLADPTAVAALFLGTPYLWGGNAAFGIDCSGLIQAACLACGIPCPGDSDMQAAELGALLPEGTPPQRGDLLFWKGHVALVVSGDTLIHANVHHMAVAYEPLDAAIERIAQQGDGPVTAHRRLPVVEV